MGGRKSYKRRSLCWSSTKTRAKRSKSQIKPEHVEDGEIVGNVDPEVKTLVKVRKTQINLTSQYESRNTISFNDHNNLIPLKVEVPSVIVLFQKYGKYFAVNNSGATNRSSNTRDTQIKTIDVAASHSTSPAKTLMENERNEPSKNIQLPKKVKITVVNTENIVSINDLTQTPIPNTFSHKKKKNKKNKKKKRPLISTVQDMKSITMSEVQPPSAKSAPVLPKSVPLKKNLMEKIIQQVVAERNKLGDKEMEVVNYERRTQKCMTRETLVSSLTSPVIPEVNHVGIYNTTEQFNITPVSYIENNGINMSTEFSNEIVPKLEAVSVSSASPPLRVDNYAVDKFISEEIQPLVIDIITGPVDQVTLDKNKSNQKELAKPSLTKSDSVPSRPVPPKCIKCNLSFLNATSFLTHVREFHKVESFDPTERSRSTSALQDICISSKMMQCDFCSFISNSEAGLKLHTKYKHPDSQPKQQLISKPSSGKDAEKCVYACYLPNCEQQYTSFLNLRLHKAIKHEYSPGSRISCILCPGKFETPSTFLYHLRTTHAGTVDSEGYRVFDGIKQGKKKLALSKAFPMTGLPQNKIQEQKTRGRPTCPQCNVSFQWEANLEMHMQDFHNGLRIVSVSGNRKSSTGNRKSSTGNKPTSSSSVVPILPTPNPIPTDTTKSKEPETITLSDDEIEIVPVNLSTKKSTTTSCPYCCVQVALDEFGAHVDKHASVTTYEVKKFSCPHSGCTTETTFSSFKEVQDHSREMHYISFDIPISEPESQVTTYVCSLCPNMSYHFTSRKTYDDHLRSTHRITPRQPSSKKDGEAAPLIICNLCDNLNFPTLKALKKHCKRMHPVTLWDNAARTDTRALTPVIGKKEAHNLGRGKESVNPSSMFYVTPMATRMPETKLTVTPIAIDPHPKAVSSFGQNTEAEKETGTVNQSLEVTPLIIQVFKCPVCGSTEFNNQAALEKHMLVHQSDVGVTTSLVYTNFFLCTECNLQFNSLDDINQHAVTFHKQTKNDRPVFCPICNYLVKQGRNLPRHIFTQHKMYQCISCSQVISGLKSFNKHQDLHTVPADADSGIVWVVHYRCLECLQVFTSKYNLALHYDSLHRGGTKCTCVTCGIQLQRKNLEIHLQLHSTTTSSPPSISSTLGAETPIPLRRESTKKMHQQPEASMFCTESGCTKAFKNSIFLEAHLKQCHASPIAPVQVLEIPDPLVESILPDAGIVEEEIDSTFHISLSYPTSSDFEFEDVDIGEENGEAETDPLDPGDMRSEYIDEHLPSTSVTMSQTFNYNYLDSSGLSEIGEPLSVGSSGGYLSEAAGLETEGLEAQFGQLITTGEDESSSNSNEKPFSCPLCPKRFRRKDNRKLHLKKVHHENISYQCSFCGECYKNNNAFTRHINSAHTDVTSEYKKQTSGRRGRGRGSGLLGPSRQRIHSISSGQSVKCQYCGESFLGVMERRKHELVHFDPLDVQRDEQSEIPDRRVSVDLAQQLEQVQGPMNVQDFFDDEGGMLNAENIFLPLEIMMNAEVELPTTTDVMKEDGSSTGINSTTQSAYIPESLDEFIALL